MSEKQMSKEEMKHQKKTLAQVEGMSSRLLMAQLKSKNAAKQSKWFRDALVAKAKKLGMKWEEPKSDDKKQPAGKAAKSEGVEDANKSGDAP